MPSNLKASPTNPGANFAPPFNCPLFEPTMSFVFPSPGHQLTAPDGSGAHPLLLESSPSRLAPALQSTVVTMMDRAMVGLRNAPKNLSVETFLDMEWLLQRECCCWADQSPLYCASGLILLAVVNETGKGGALRAARYSFGVEMSEY